MQNKLIRIGAAMLIISPWIYIPSVYKDILFFIIGIILIATTIDIKKKVKLDMQ